MLNQTVFPSPGSKRRIGYAAILSIALLLSIFTRTLMAQDNTLYLMPGIPQANQLNPALIPFCKIYVELPVISSIKLNFRNTGFGFHDLVHTGTGIQSGTYYLDLANLDKKLKRMNYLRTDVDINLLGFGINLRDWSFTFGIVNHTELRIAYPHDLASLKDGNWQVASGEATPLSLDGLGIDLTNWNSIGVSVAKELNNRLTVGARLKYLQGVANINTRRSTIELITTTNPITLEALVKYRMNASFPIKLGYDNKGLVNSININDVLNNFTGDFIFNKNRGIAFDAGFVYDIDDRTQVSASFTDLGFIWWRKNVNNFEAGGK
jgi:hypothetical protein